MSKASSIVKIPKERLGVLIGPDGKFKEFIEKKLGLELKIGSESGSVTILLARNNLDPSTIFRGKEVVQAVSRGFSPERVHRLVEDEEAVLDVIDLREVVGKSEADIKRLKGRIIGKGGKTRKIIEELSEANISVYGHTIGIIGDMEQVQVARDAIKMFLTGRQHRTVYRFLHRKKRDLKRRRLEIWESGEKP